MAKLNSQYGAGHSLQHCDAVQFAPAIRQSYLAYVRDPDHRAGTPEARVVTGEFLRVPDLERERRAPFEFARQAVLDIAEWRVSTANASFPRLAGAATSALSTRQPLR